MQAKVVDGIGASRQGSPPLVSCAVTRDQLHRQRGPGHGPGGMHDGRSAGATAIKEDPVRGMSAHFRARPQCINMQARQPVAIAAGGLLNDYRRGEGLTQPRGPRCGRRRSDR